MIKRGFMDEIRSSVLIGDGALGTELAARGTGCEKGIEKLNLLSPDLVLNLHREYVAAGSQVIETNTFGANRASLSRYGADDKASDIIQAGVKLAKEAAGHNVYVAGSIGPLPVMDGEPFTDAQRIAYLTEHIETLIDCEVDILLFESFADADELVTAVKLAKSRTDIPIIAQSAFDSTGHTATGVSAGEVGKRVLAAGADMTGANCGYGVPSIIESIKRMSKLDVPLSAYMNAGFPEQIDNRLMYRSTPEYLAGRALDLLKMGVRLVGGCCGTGPAAIRAIAEAVRSNESLTVSVSHVFEARVDTAEKTEPVPHRITSWRMLVELDPPTKPDLEPIKQCASKLKDAGVDAITIADNPLASSRVDTLMTASTIQREIGIPVIPHLTGRDRNKIALQSVILGAHATGIRTLLCVTGDPVRMCQQPNTSGVFDVNSVGLVKLLSDFNISYCQDEPKAEPISIGVALNPNVRNLSGQIDKLRRKIEAGADFALTQPVYTEDRLSMLEEAMKAENISLPVYIGILPLTSLKNADFVHNEVPGIVVPDQLRQLMAKYSTIADQRAACVDFCVDFISRIRSRVNGFYFMTPRNRVDLLAPMLGAAR